MERYVGMQWRAAWGCLTLLALLVGCRSAPSGAPPEPEAAVTVRLVNATAAPLEEIVLQYEEESVRLDSLAAGAESVPLSFAAIYQSPLRFEATQGGERLVVERLDGGPGSGEQPISTGEYVLTVSPAGEGLTLALAPAETASDSALVESLRAAGLMVEQQPIIQRPTLFDRLAGETITRREILATDAGLTLDYFRFADSATADAMAAALRPGGTLFRLPRADGSVAEERVESFDLQEIGWWRVGDGLILYQGGDPAIIQRVTDALDSEARLDAPQSEAELRIVNFTGEAIEGAVLEPGGREIEGSTLAPGGVSAYAPLGEGERLVIRTTGRSRVIEIASDAVPAQGRYTLVLGRENDVPSEALLDDRSWPLDAALLGGPWHWTEVEGADGSRRAPEFGEQRSSLTFRTVREPNGMGGYMVDVQYPCNAGSAAYRLGVEGAMVMLSGARTMIGCEEAIMADELLLLQTLMRAVVSYEVAGERLALQADGATFLFERAPE